MDTQEVEECLKLAQKGDLDAFTRLVLDSQDRLRAYILWHCPSAGIVDDFAQACSEVHHLPLHLRVRPPPADRTKWTETAEKMPLSDV